MNIIYRVIRFSLARNKNNQIHKNKIIENKEKTDNWNRLIQRLLVQMRWYRSIFPCSFLLSSTVSLRIGTEDNQRNTPEGCKKKVSWFVITGLEEHYSHGTSWILSAPSHTQKVTYTWCFLTHWSSNRTRFRWAYSSLRAQGNPSESIKQVWKHWQGHQLGTLTLTLYI